MPARTRSERANAPTRQQSATATAAGPQRSNKREQRPNDAGSARSVQSLERAFELLERLAEAGGSASLSELAGSSGLPLATIHRLMGTLVGRGYVRRVSARRYALGPRLVRLGEQATRMLGAWAERYLRELVELTGETANLAVLEGDRVIYLAQAPGRHSMRMFTEPGRRVDPHCTAVGKAMLAKLPWPQVQELLSRTGMTRYTPATITDPNEFAAHLETVRQQGFALDEGEQEVGVRCIAVAVADTPSPTALSVSGPKARLTDQAISTMAPALARIAKELTAELSAADEG